MSSLFDHNSKSLLSPFTKVYKLKNKNKQGHKRVTFNVRQIRSPDARSTSLRKKSASKLFNLAHKIPSQTTQSTSHGSKEEKQFIDFQGKQNEGDVTAVKTRRTNTLQERRKKITLKKQLSLKNEIQKTVQVCVNDKTVLKTKEEDLVNSLTRLIMDDVNQGISTINQQEVSSEGLDQFLRGNTDGQNSFELEIDSNLIQGNKELLEWSDLIKRI